MSTSTAAAPRGQLRERPVQALPVRRVLPAAAVALILAVALLILGVKLQAHGHGIPGTYAGAVVLAAVGLLGLRGLITVPPGEAVVVQLFGGYQGTIRDPGLSWVVPWAKRRRMSLKIRSHESPLAKVSDADGNPIEIGVVTVWQVTDTAQAVFAVDDVATFVAVQAEIGLRQIASSYPYDDFGSGKPCLRVSAGEITTLLTAEIAARVASAGVHVREARLTRLGYAPEIAHAMLRRQQADAVVAARQKIVDGAVAMVQAALDRLAEDDIVEFDEERKAAMVSNMLVVLCSDQATQPVVNTGTLYQ
jgi:regulator of protease activity HflC (stomatin/prohibitin superfamily)